MSGYLCCGGGGVALIILVLLSLSAALYFSRFSLICFHQILKGIQEDSIRSFCDLYTCVRVKKKLLICL